ncbi:hypothetical protein BpHYR1_034656 [Brachionus plicatilis]|uniref:Uncharacterized protein n=1 Tax=Brachionus plicatilis TaxID=10195 RepID=A0A3M7SY86_BRAPC|nr:hypothetical protein BpHYR1_034656 [Brachionus plicatilis]
MTICLFFISEKVTINSQFKFKFEKTYQLTVGSHSFHKATVELLYRKNNMLLGSYKNGNNSSFFVCRLTF